MNQVTSVFRWIALGILCVVIISYLLFGVRLFMPVDIFTALQSHHDTIRGLLADTEDNRAFFPQVKKHLEAHHKGEEDTLFNTLKANAELRRKALVAVEEHHVIDMLLGELAEMSGDPERWGAKYEVMREFVEHHLEEEEKDIFPEAEKVLEKEQKRDMGARFEKERKMILWGKEA